MNGNKIYRKDSLIKEINLNSLVKNTEEFDEQIIREDNEFKEKYLKYKIEKYRKDDAIKVRIYFKIVQK